MQNAPKTPFSLKAVLLLSLPCVGLTALSLAASPAPTAQTPKKSAAKPPVSAATGKFVAEVRPLLAKHCVVCHNAKSPLGNLDFAHFPDEASVRKDPATWRTIRRRVADKEMPPPTEPPLPEAKRTALLAWIDKTLASLPATATAPKPVAAIPSVRRLTRYEYDRTIKDLIGFEFDSAEAVGMPDDAVPEGFDNRAAALNISPVLMEKYSNAAEKIIEQLIPGPDGRPRVTRDVYEHQMAYRAIFQRGPRNKNVPPREAAQTILSQFARRAYRRSVRETEVERLMQIYDLAVKKGLRQEEAVGWGMRAVLVSPYFLLRVEQPATPPKSASAPTNKLDDYELATRLSYFLWSTMPDEILLDLADQKRLSEPNVLAEQVKRMLADAKAKALTENFAVQWLQLRKLDTARPSIENFPTFNATLREAMRNETTLFFDKLRQEDKPVLDLLTADYTYANEPLAKHYGLSGVTGREMKLVKLRSEDKRGGLLGMGSILAMTSHTYRTSPTQRGKWILEVLFGTPPPPPPPGVSTIEAEKDGKAPGNFRELMQQHSQQPACAACHQKMDPLGYALDNYDAIGRWRLEQGGKPLDTSGQLPTGEKLTGAEDLKGFAVSRKEAFVRNLTGQLLQYALGREKEPDDEAIIKAITERAALQEHRFTALITGIVQSESFRARRTVPATPLTPPKKKLAAR